MSVRSVTLMLSKPWINLYRLWDEDRIGLLAFDSASAKLIVTADAVRAPLLKVRGITDPQVDFSGGKIKIHARFNGFPRASGGAP